MKNMTKVKKRYNTCMYATYTSACVLTRMYIVYHMVYLEKKKLFLKKYLNINKQDEEKE